MTVSQVMRRGLLVALGLCVWRPTAGLTEEYPIDPKEHAQRIPSVYMTTFMNGYGGGALPQDPAQFERLVKAVSEEGNFSAVLCEYTKEREAICKKYNLVMMVDLLAPAHHVYKNVEACESLLKSLQGNETVQAYHVWSDRFGDKGAGRARDIDNVHRWDPTTAVLCGTYSGRGFNYLARADLISNYNFSWKRGPHKNFRDLVAAWEVAKQHNSRLGRYLTTDAGLAGRGNPNRLLYIQNTSIAFGLRAGLWHIGSRIMDMESCQLNQYGLDVAKVNAWTKPLWHEIPKLGLPTSVYSTAWTKDWNNKEAAGYPPHLETFAFPEDFWIQPQSGEFLMTMGPYGDTKTQYAYLANHNAYAPQDVKLKIGKNVKVRIFNREAKAYEPARIGDGVLQLELEPAGGALLLIDA